MATSLVHFHLNDSLINVQRAGNCEYNTAETTRGVQIVCGKGLNFYIMADMLLEIYINMVWFNSNCITKCHIHYSRVYRVIVTTVTSLYKYRLNYCILHCGFIISIFKSFMCFALEILFRSQELITEHYSSLILTPVIRKHTGCLCFWRQKLNWLHQHHVRRWRK